MGEEKEEDDINEAEDRFLQKLMVQCLAGITLRGITNISKVYMREEARTIYNPQLVSRDEQLSLLPLLFFLFRLDTRVGEQRKVYGRRSERI